MAVEDRTEVVDKQKSLFGDKDINILQFKNLKEKQEAKSKILSMFGGEMIRSVITSEDKNIRINKIDRQKQEGDRSSVQNTIERADKFSKKDILAISTFPSIITMAYVNLLSKEGDKVYDAFMGHNSRAEDVLALNRKYYAYDVHSFPLEFTKKSVIYYPQENYELNLGSSEKVKYEDESMDFSITCPPYFDVEKYNKIYNEEIKEDLSSKDYQDFLWLYNKCLSETFRVLKKGAYFVLIVGDVRRDGQYISLMTDTIKICKLLGFELHDINIYNRRCKYYQNVTTE